MRCDRSITTLPTLTHWAAFSAKRGGATIQMPSFGPIGTPLLWKHRLRAQRPANGPSELDSERGTAHTALPHQRLAAVLWTYPIHWVCRRPNLDRFVILKSRDNLTALSCVRRLRVELLEIEKKDLDLVEVLDGPDGLERRLHDRRDILTEAEAQPGATSETITAALLDELREIRSSGPSASLPSTGDNAPTPLDESRLVAILTGSDNAAFRKITMVLSGLDLSTPSGQRDALALGYDGQCAITAQVLFFFSTAESGDLTVVRRHSTLSQLNELRQHRTAYFHWHLRVGKDMAIADCLERYSIAPILDGGDRTVLEGWLHLDLDTTDFIKAPHGGMGRLQHQDGRSVPVVHGPADYFCRPSVTELTQSGIATIDESGEMHMDTVASDAGSTTPLSSADVPPAPDPSTLPYCNCHRRCFNRIWPQDRSPLCDFCYDGCDDCECAGEALGPQGQPCCVRPLEAATVCGECTGEVTPVTRTLGQMAVATPAGFAPRCSAPGCEAGSQLLADQLGHLRCSLAQAQAGQILQPKGAHEPGLVPSLRDSSGEGGPIEQPSRRAAGPAAAEPAAISAVLAVAHDPADHFCQPSVTELTQSGIATIDESGGRHILREALSLWQLRHERRWGGILDHAGKAGTRSDPNRTRGEPTNPAMPTPPAPSLPASPPASETDDGENVEDIEEVEVELEFEEENLVLEFVVDARAPCTPTSPPAPGPSTMASDPDVASSSASTPQSAGGTLGVRACASLDWAGSGPAPRGLEAPAVEPVMMVIESSPFPEPVADAPGAPPPAVVPPEPVPLEAPLFEEHLIFHEPLDMPANVGPRLADALAPSLRGKLESAVVTLMVAGVGGDVPDLFDIKSASVRRARASLRKHSVSVDEWEAPKIKAAAWLAQYVAPPHETTSVRYMADNPLRRHAFGLLRHHMLVLADARDVHDSFGNYEMFIAGISDVAEIFEDIVVGARVVYDDNGADGDDADHSGVMLEPFVPAGLAVLVPLRPSEDTVAGPALDPTPTEPTAKPTPPAPSLPASPPASETDDDEEVEDIEEVEVELEFEEENLVLEVVVDAWAPCTPTSLPAPGLSTMASNTAVTSPSTSSPRSAGGTLGVRACASLDWAGSGPAPRGLEVIYLAAGTTRLITARDPELNGGDWGGTYNVRVSPPEAETGLGSDYEVRITSERRHPRDQDAPTLLISWLSAWGRPLSSKLPAITTIEASARNTFGVETQRLSHGEIIAYGTPNGYWSGSTLLTPHLATTRLYWAFRLNVRSEPPLVPGPPGWPRRPPQSTPGNSEPGRRRQSSHLLFEASSCTAEQVEWARRFIASPSPAGETTAGGDEQAGAVAYAAAATAAATEHGHGAPR